MRKNSIARAHRLARSYLSPKRFAHSKSLMVMALELQRVWGGNKELLIKSALLHDLGYSFGAGALEHGPRAAALLTGGFSRPVLEIVRKHTLADEEMTLEEEIIYLADAIEEGRYFPGIFRLRELAFTNLDRALLAYIESSENHLSSRGQSLHINTIRFRKKLRRYNGRTSKRNSGFPRKETGRRSVEL